MARVGDPLTPTAARTDTNGTWLSVSHSMRGSAMEGRQSGTNASTSLAVQRKRRMWLSSSAGLPPWKIMTRKFAGRRVLFPGGGGAGEFFWCKKKGGEAIE